jgi:hypothetical protein
MDKSAETLLKIILKAVVFVAVVICIFLLVYPHTCFNMRHNYYVDDDSRPGDLQVNSAKMTSTGEEAFAAAAGASVQEAKTPPPAEVNPADAQLPEAAIVAAQDAWDYNAVRRYVEIENELKKEGPLTKEVSARALEQLKSEKKDITDEVWSEIMEKALRNGWFDAARKELSAAPAK